MNFGTLPPISDVFTEYVQDKYVKELNTETKKIFLDSNNREIGIINLKFRYWKVYQYDKQGNQTYVHDSENYWEKRKYLNGNIIQFSDSSGAHWVKNKV